MAHFPTNEGLKDDGLGDADDHDVRPARSRTLPASWVSTVSYWCDYLTIIDMQGPNDPAAQEAS
jgi:hypothetical protein